MEERNPRDTFFKKKILNSKFIVYTIIVFLLSITTFALSKITFILVPFAIFAKTIFLPVLLAGVCFYLFNPLINYLEKKGNKRILSILLLYLVIIGLLAIVILSVIPPLKDQVQSLVSNIPKISHDIQDMVQNVSQNKYVKQGAQSTNTDIDKVSKSFSGHLNEYISGFSQGVLTFIGTLTEVILAFAVLPFILFYLLKDGKDLPKYIVRLLPNQTRPEAKEIFGDMNHALSSYIRGQLFVATCIGVLFFIGYLIIGIDYALLLAIIAMLTNVVPYLGPIIAILPAIIIAFVMSPFMVLKLAVVWIIVQLLEGKLISPQIMGKSLNIHPITVIFVILTAGNLFGIIGIILAVPGYAILKVIVTHLYQFIRLRSSMYTDTKKIKKEEPIPYNIKPREEK
ncbi:AI-2E family transporter [Bacillus sp. ISL-53]|uniref:AI-2E family transporter n=1 Tax=unclassified Bacillus (in: firmicutes) TaxID=185979 RepID=UPI001BECBCC5|nr:MULTISPECIES: AI-2E family transporter [unclassified Bacillus (in: firmicutes)]MBT2603789.1 AI-2E family transporter [Bacillus sp. ISL-53]MBT2618534.1 AI-2E family transporter [Bacillus sp. ISL-78]MBT2632224.1 AI-2E family transporter [Bacillus sp. ISL-101]MBT2717239.1 AI-2E family transporter [Bacillus sp. ISL-57]